jgi:hypothetical protein
MADDQIDEEATAIRAAIRKAMMVRSRKREPRTKETEQKSDPEQNDKS